MINALITFQYIPDEDFESASVPLGGDQLTRVCFNSAKNLRASARTRTDKLEQLSPIIEELFHVEQDLLDVSDTCDTCTCNTCIYKLLMCKQRQW